LQLNLPGSIIIWDSNWIPGCEGQIYSELQRPSRQIEALGAKIGVSENGHKSI
jgi:hypothetical protein